MQAMVAWLDILLSEHSGGIKTMSILDVGTGNALLPLELAKLGYSDVTGSDYSPQSVALSHHILRRHKQSQIRLVVCAKLSSWYVYLVSRADSSTFHLQVDDLLQTCLQSRHVATAALVPGNKQVLCLSLHAITFVLHWCAEPS